MDTTPGFPTDLLDVAPWQDLSSANLAAFWESLVRPMQQRRIHWNDLNRTTTAVFTVS